MEMPLNRFHGVRVAIHIGLVDRVGRRGECVHLNDDSEPRGQWQLVTPIGLVGGMRRGSQLRQKKTSPKGRGFEDFTSFSLRYWPGSVRWRVVLTLE